MKTVTTRHEAGSERPALDGPPPEATPRRIDVEVSTEGFSPDRILVKAGEPLTFAFTRTTDRTCAKSVVLELGGGRKIERSLPLGETVTIDATFPRSGDLVYACPMDMVTGVVTVTPMGA
jgi:plastocyanin domain-containing protein